MVIESFRQYYKASQMTGIKIRPFQKVTRVRFTFVRRYNAKRTSYPDWRSQAIPSRKEPRRGSASYGCSTLEGRWGSSVRSARSYSCSLQLRSYSMCMTTNNYINALIEPAEDCKVPSSTIPTERGGKPTVATTQYAILADPSERKIRATRSSRK